MKSVVELWSACLNEAGGLYSVRTSKDMAYAMSRIEDEGLEFLTLTLPRFEKDFLKSLSTGVIDSNQFAGFRRSGGLPSFLKGFLCRVFDKSGVLRSDADPGIIRAVRQILLLMSKIEIPCSSNRVNLALEQYISTDAELEDISEVDLYLFRRVSENLLGSYLRDVESLIWSGEWQPRYSSGALATGESYNSRFASALWTERLQRVLRWEDDLVSSPRELIDRVEDVQILSEEQEIPCKVITVPKTMKGPRVIAMEPVYNQFIQQGVLHAMTDVLSLRKYSRISSIFSWADQEPNRSLSRRGSVDGSFATLDLSEASDRVHFELARALLSPAPLLRSIAEASRSKVSRVVIDNKEHLIRLNKFSSMGSALCFPIESMVFFIIEAIAYAESSGIDPLSLRTRDLPEMRVYGDDLIVPSTVAQTLAIRLKAFGLKVNSDKSFLTGLFRESCGKEWFRGEDVSVFRVRAPLPSQARHHQLLEKAISLHNRAFSAGWFETAGYIERYLLGNFERVPFVPYGVDVPGLWTYDDSRIKRRSHPRLQRVEYLAFNFKLKKPSDPLDGWGAMRKFYAPRLEPRDIDHLTRDGRSRYVSTNIGWRLPPL